MILPAPSVAAHVATPEDVTATAQPPSVPPALKALVVCRLPDAEAAPGGLNTATAGNVRLMVPRFQAGVSPT